jgi:hypothetical protein
MPLPPDGSLNKEGEFAMSLVTTDYPESWPYDADVDGIDVDAGTLAEAAMLIMQENPKRHNTIVGVQSELAAMLNDNIWSGTTAEHVVAEYYNVLIATNFKGSYEHFKSYAQFLKESAETYGITEEACIRLGESFNMD